MRQIFCAAIAAVRMIAPLVGGQESPVAYQASDIFWPTVRARMSVVLPGEKPTRMRIGFVG